MASIDIVVLEDNGVVISKHGSSRQGVQAGAGEGTMMEPPSVKSKLMMEDEKICSSGLYVTNCARDSLQQQPDSRQSAQAVEKKSLCREALQLMGGLG